MTYADDAQRDAIISPPLIFRRFRYRYAIHAMQAAASSHARLIIYAMTSLPRSLITPSSSYAASVDGASAPL